jgi:hypothetical protein
MLHFWMGMPISHPILFQREKGNVNASGHRELDVNFLFYRFAPHYHCRYLNLLLYLSVLCHLSFYLYGLFFPILIRTT